MEVLKISVSFIRIYLGEWIEAEKSIVSEVTQTWIDKYRMFSILPHLWFLAPVLEL